LLVRIPTNYHAPTLSISEDGKDYAFVIQTSDGCHVVQRNQEGPAYAECGPLGFAPASPHVFYWATESVPFYKRFFHWVTHWGAAVETLPVLIANGQQLAPGFAQAVPITFSVDGTRWAVVGKEPDRHVGDKTEVGAVAVFADGRALGRYKDTSQPAFSPDGKHLAYLIENEDGQFKLIVDGAERRTFERQSVAAPEITQGAAGSDLTQRLRVTYLSDGTLVEIAPSRDGWTVYHDDQPLASYAHNVSMPEQGTVVRLGEMPGPSTAVFPRSLSIAAHAPVAAWWARTEGHEEHWQVARNGTPDTTVCARYRSSDLPVLSSDGRRLTYACYLHPEEQSDEVMVVADDKQFGPYENAAGMIFSDDGGHFAYMAADGSPPFDWSYHVDGKASPLRFEAVWQPRFNKTGTHIAWEALRGKRPMLFLDGRGVRSFDEVLWGPMFSPEKVSWVIRRGRRIMRVEVPLEP